MVIVGIGRTPDDTRRGPKEANPKGAAQLLLLRCGCCGGGDESRGLKPLPMLILAPLLLLLLLLLLMLPLMAVPPVNET